MMKKNVKFSMMALGVLAGGLLSSCTVNDTPSPQDAGSMLARAPKIEVYSGSGDTKTYWDAFGGTATRSADPNSNMWENVPSNITEEERDKVMDWFSTHQYPESISLDWTDFFVQQLGYNPEPHVAYDGNTKHYPANQMNQLAAGKEGQPDEINNFNANTAFNAIMKMVNSSTENFSYKNSSGSGERWYDKFVIVYIDGAYYVGFDFYSHTPWEANKNEQVDADGYYNDWIVKITPADGVIVPPADDNNKDKKENCPDCNDPLEDHHDGFCDDCQQAGGGACFHEDETNVGGDDNNGNNGDDNGDDVPETVVPGDRHNNEIEVNLNGTDKGDGLLESHLSIHVRAATDVEIFIPVPKKYQVEADDMAIVMQHEINHMLHGETFEFSYTLKDSELVVSIKIAYEEDGIRIITDGITQEVIDWCMEKCNDGITFEIWNYFDADVIDFEALKEYLNQATIKFLDECPDYYINAFTEEDGHKNPEDCRVDIVDEQRGNFAGNPEIGPHLNGSDKNVIYTNNDASGHDEL